MDMLLLCCPLLPFDPLSSVNPLALLANQTSDKPRPGQLPTNTIGLRPISQPCVPTSVVPLHFSRKCKKSYSSALVLWSCVVVGFLVYLRVVSFFLPTVLCSVVAYELFLLLLFRVFFVTVFYIFFNTIYCVINVFRYVYVSICYEAKRNTEINVL